MDLYVVVWEDRHTDTTVHLFTRPGAAITWAKQQAREHLRHSELRESYTTPGWLYYANYAEGGRIWVIKKAIFGGAAVDYIEEVSDEERD
jgi:hypothetical protein